MDEIQAEYVAEIKLRHLNREYILRRTQEMEQLRTDIDSLQQTLESPKKIRAVIAKELKETAKKYGQPRKTQFCEVDLQAESDPTMDIPDYPVHLFLSESGYFKKISPASLRMNAEQKLKEDDRIIAHWETTNRTELLFFTNQQQVYKTKASVFEDSKASLLGDYIPAKLGFDEGEFVVSVILTNDYSGMLLFVYENGKVAKVPLQSYATKTNRKKLANAYSDKSPLVTALPLPEEQHVLLRSSGNRALLFQTEELLPKTARNTQGVQVMTLKGKQVVLSAELLTAEQAEERKRYQAKTLPALGALAKDLPDVGQMTLA